MQIPVEWLFGVLAALVAGTYLNLLWELRRLRTDSNHRNNKLLVLTLNMKNVCERLNIDFNTGD